MPCNLYGPNDNFDLTGSHVLPALIRKFHEAKVRGGPVEVWGDGSARREFLHVDDLAEAALVVAGRESLRDLPLGFLNAGSGRELSIRELASLVADITGYRGERRLGRLQAERDAQEDPGFQPAALPGLEAADRAGRRHRGHVSWYLEKVA